MTGRISKIGDKELRLAFYKAAKLFGLQLSPMDSRCRDQDGLALLTNAGRLLGDFAQRLCLRTTKGYPASFGGRRGSHSALRDKLVLVVRGLPRARDRSQGCRAKFDRHSLAGAAAPHYPKQTALARSAV